jgi:hypothetical protein
MVCLVVIGAVCSVVQALLSMRIVLIRDFAASLVVGSAVSSQVVVYARVLSVVSRGISVECLEVVHCVFCVVGVSETKTLQKTLIRLHILSICTTALFVFPDNF